jgi:hypothetical protein
MSLTRTQWIEPSRSPEILKHVFHNLSAFCFTTKVYKVQDGYSKSHNSYKFQDLDKTIDRYYWMFYSKGSDRLYTLVYLDTQEYVYIKTKGVTGRNGETKKMRIYVSTSMEDLLHTALTRSEYKRYLESISFV